MPLIDNRDSSKDLASGSRKRFIERYKHSIKKAVHDAAKTRKIKNTVNNTRMRLKRDNLSEPTFRKDRNSGTHRTIFTGNKKYTKGETILKPRAGGMGGGGGPGDPTEDEFVFTLTKEEFIDIYFQDMELPDFVKKSLKQSSIMIRKRAGVAPVGPPPRLNYKKTIMQHLMRQIATKGEPDNTVPLDPIDLRYNKYNKYPIEDKEAVMICLMDVSGSMGESEKTTAKKFFLLLYLFLQKSHEKVDIVFIRHTDDAQEVDEETFFQSKESGGTIVSTALKLASQIIETRYSPQTNVYIAQASDGDNWDNDNVEVIQAMYKLLPQLQYMAYIQTEGEERQSWKKKLSIADLWDVYEYVQLKDTSKVLHMRRIEDASDVFDVLRDLFKKR